MSIEECLTRVPFLLHHMLLISGRNFVAVWLGRQAMEVIDRADHAATPDVVGGEESARYTIVNPGVYLWRTEENVSIMEASLSWGGRS